jgi:hypothetical protein
MQLLYIITVSYNLSTSKFIVFILISIKYYLVKYLLFNYERDKSGSE